MTGRDPRGLARTVAAVVAWAAAAGPVLGQVRPALEGYTGQLTTPSAWTAPAGTAHLLFTNAEDARYRELSSTRTFALTAGLLRWVEAGGRLSEVSTERRIRDLSFHLKLRLPLDLLLPDLPLAFAVGSQDEGGAATFFRSRYAVASARAWRLQGSVGYGIGPNRMEGWFGGGSVALASWLEAVGDWDGDDLNAGVRASIPLARLGLPFRLGGIARSAVQNSPRQVEWALTLELPLWLHAGPEGRHFVEPPSAAVAVRPTPPPTAPALVAAAGVTPLPVAATAAPASRDAPEDPRAALRALEDELVEIGFEEVRAGLDGERVVVEYENNLYNHDEADALHVVLRELERAGLDGRALSVVVKRSGLRVAEISVPAAGDGDALAREGGAPRWRSGPARRDHVAWVSPGPRNRRALHSTLVLAPGIRTFVGTEVGMLDYLVTFRPDLIVPFWPGATGVARAEIPLFWSDDLDDGRIFRDFRNPARLEYALVHQAVRLAPGTWAMVGGGVFQATDAGGLGEVLWTGAGGALALGALGSWTVNDRYEERKALMGSARLRFAPLDATVLVRAGRFVNGDRGATAELSRWFGDTQVGVFYTRSEGYTPSQVEIAGAFFNVPLTFRRDMRPGWLQVRGPRRWGHGLGTQVRADHNYILQGVGVVPLSPWNLEAVYLDGGRISRDGLVEPVRELPALSR